MPDSIDEQIARLLSMDARQNSETLAKQLKLSSATVRRRLRNLIRSDAMRIVAVVDPTKFGLSVAVVIALDVDPGKTESVMEELNKKPGIRWVSLTTGRFDLIALARFRSFECFSEFMTKEMASLKGLRDSETFICLDVKVGRYITLLPF